MTADISSWSDDEITEFYKVEEHQWLRTNMVLSFDGNYVGPTGSSRDISHPFDLKILLIIRALSDCILVGARTALGEKYTISQTQGDLGLSENKPPRLAVVSETLQLPASAPMFQSAALPIVITRRSADPDWKQRKEALDDIAEVQVLESDSISGLAIRNALHEAGLNHIVCEGGPKLLDTMLANEAVDEIDVTTSPTILGHVNSGISLGTHHKSMRFHSRAQAHDFLFSRLVK